MRGRLDEAEPGTDEHATLAEELEKAEERVRSLGGQVEPAPDDERSEGG